MQAGRIERIGKKYQRIGLMELLARLADNDWLKPNWGTAARAYDNPTDVSYMRDLEPHVSGLIKTTASKCHFLTQAVGTSVYRQAIFKIPPADIPQVRRQSCR